VWHASAKSSCGGSRGESAELLSRELGLPIFTLEQWHEKADAALDGALKEREADAASIELDAAMTRIGEPAWRSSGSRAHRETRPFGPQEVALMAKAISPVSGQPYGIQRVCRLWDVPRSSFHAAQVKSAMPAAPPAGGGLEARDHRRGFARRHHAGPGDLALVVAKDVVPGDAADWGFSSESGVRSRAVVAVEPGGHGERPLG
jgi:hypothetical protein